MNSGFLNICDDEITEIDTHIFQGNLKLSRYQFSMKANFFSTILEGIHQFAAKISCLSGQLSDDALPLPVQIDEFWLEKHYETSPSFLLLTATIEQIATFFVIKGKIYDLRDKRIGGFQVKTANVPYVSHQKKEDEAFHTSDDPQIFNIHEVVRHSDRSIELPFSFSKQSFLAYEHFPGSPILPASQIIALSKQACADHFKMSVNRIERSSFIQPVQCGIDYMLELTRLSEEKVKFSLKLGETVYSKGLMRQTSSMDA